MHRKTKLLANTSILFWLIFPYFSSSLSATTITFVPNSVNYNSYVPQFDSFTGWCENKASLDEETKATIKLLLATAQTVNCQQANEKLSALNYLSLSSQETIYGTVLINLAPLSNLTNLKELHLDNNGISDLNPLSNLTNLRKLFLNNNHIRDLTPVSTLTNLQELYLMGNQIKDVTALSNLNYLHTLVLQDNQIVDVKPISNLTKLKTLDLNSNQITNIKSLASLQKLDVVYVQNNPLTSRNCPINRCSFSPHWIVRWLHSVFRPFFLPD